MNHSTDALGFKGQVEGYADTVANAPRVDTASALNAPHTSPNVVASATRTNSKSNAKPLPAHNGTKLAIFGIDSEIAISVMRQLSATGYDYELLSDWRRAENSPVSELPAIVCVDSASPDECLQMIGELSRGSTTVLAVCAAGESMLASYCLEAGAVEALTMPVDARQFEEAIDTVAYRAEIRKYHGSMSENADLLQSLTPRELRIVQLASDGLPNKQIATTIGLSVKSIERIRRDAYRKLRVRSTAEMTRVFLLGSLYPRLSRIQALEVAVQ